MRLKGWMTKTPLSSCRIHSFSTATSLPYTYRDCLFSCGRSSALHPQVPLLHPAPGPFSFSMASLGPLSSAVRPGHPPSGCFCSSSLVSGWVDSNSIGVLTCPLGHHVFLHQASQPQGFTEAVWSEASGYQPFCFLPLSIPPSLTASLYFCPYPIPALFFFSQLINYSVSVSHPHMNQVMSTGQRPAHINTKDDGGFMGMSRGIAIIVMWTRHLPSCASSDRAISTRDVIKPCTVLPDAVHTACLWHWAILQQFVCTFPINTQKIG